MPKELTHWLLADEAAVGLGSDSRLRKVIEDHRATYLGGAVLPDTLLHLFRSPHAAEALALAHVFHDTADNSFAPLILAENAFPGGVPPAQMACLLGVITHIVTDIVFHPYVYALTGTAGIGRHYQIETGIDVHFLQTGARPAVKHVTGLINLDTRDTLVSTSALLFDPTGTLPRPVLEQALSLHCRLQSMYDKAFWKLAVRLLAIAKGSPFREQCHLFYPLSRSHTVGGIAATPQQWRHPVSGELHTSTLEELASKAVQRIISLFTLIEAEGSLAVALTNSPGENMLTGLHGVCRSAMDNDRSS